MHRPNETAAVTGRFISINRPYTRCQLRLADSSPPRGRRLLEAMAFCLGGQADEASLSSMGGIGNERFRRIANGPTFKDPSAICRILEFTANRSRSPFGNGTSSRADIVAMAPIVTNIVARPETP